MTRSQESPSDAERQLHALYEDGVPAVYRVLIRLTGGHRQLAEDLTQETFVRAMQHLRRHGHDSRAATPSVGWLTVIARNLFIDSVRRTSRHDAALEALTAGERLLESARTVVDEQAWETIDASGALEALGRLPADQRAALVLHHIDGMSIKELADLFGRSVRAIESLLARGRRRLAELVLLSREANHVD